MCALPMLRRLLACLALLTGLAATSTPVHGEVMALCSRVEASASGVSSTDNQAKPIVEIRAPGRNSAGSVVVEPVAPRCSPAPAVRLLSDRARE